ncbi:MAG: 50S ribosomal protein L19 [Candidatus Pacebacteria bacterium]|nr:50S ribosomal protein L19 [Candidatus Paceibacterota bacterium]
MNQKIIALNKEMRGEAAAKWRAGDVVKVYLRIKEGAKERTQMFEGLVIAVKGGQSSSLTITVRKVTHGVGVEMIVPVLSKNVEKVELVKSAKVRRAKLYYVRSLTAKQSRMKYKESKVKAAGKKEEVKEVKAKKEKTIQKK